MSLHKSFLELALGQATTIKGVLSGNDHIIKYDGQEYYMGELALSQSGNINAMRIGSADRYWQLPALLSLLTSSGIAINEPEYELLLVTGLPVVSHKGDNPDKVKKLLNGTHHFRLDDRDRVAYVKVGKVLAEAAGAILAGGLDASANTYGVLDVGSYTTDIYTLRGLSPITEQCGSYEVGISRVVKEVTTVFENKNGYPFSQPQQNNILTCYLTGDYKPMGLRDHSQVADVMMWTKNAIESLSETIRTEVATYWRTGSQGLIAANFSRVEIVGGAAYYVTEFLQRSIPNLRMQKRPEYSNVRGYAGFANILLHQRGK